MNTAKYFRVVAVIVAALISPSAFAENADVRFSIGDVSFGIGIGTPPPVPIVEYVPVAVPGHVWVPGYWTWYGHRHVWTRGAWERMRPGYSHVTGHWEQRRDRWHFHPSRWEAQRAVAHREKRRGHDKHAWHDERRGHGYSRDHGSRRN